MAKNPAQFEEKEYEGPLIRELSGIAPFWSPGQVLEGHLGFDAALAVANGFWDQLGTPAAPGVNLARYGLSPMLRRRRAPDDAPEPLPDFTLNLFLQVKRPWQLAPKTAADNSLGAPAWSFDIDADQQLLLESLASHLGDHADVRYACAAFDTKAQLWQAMKERTLQANSTFPPATELAGHTRGAYDSPGASGVGLSEPERIDAPGLVDRARALAREHHPAPLPSMSGEESQSSEEWQAIQRRRGAHLVPPLARLWRSIEATLRESEDDHARAILAAAAVFGAPLTEHAQLVARISTATAHLGLQWFAIGPVSEASE